MPTLPGPSDEDDPAVPSTLAPGEVPPPVGPPPGPRGVSYPRFVGGYEILGVLGEGNMGRVLRAHQPGTERQVALKMIKSPVAGAEELARFYAEARAAARLSHPNIVQIHEVGDYYGQPFFSLELVEGGRLSDRLRGNPLAARQAACLVRTLAWGVQHAHERGIIHRDLKPQNILLALVPVGKAGGPASSPEIDPDDPGLGTPKITDFGLAKHLHESTGQTQTGVAGTPSYMAPEQADADGPAIGPATDVYALGAILYELLTGRPPFRAPTVMATLEQVRSEDPVPPRKLQSTCPRALETVCLHCLRKDPAKRYRSALDLAADLGRFLRGEPVLVHPAGVGERLVKWARRRPAAAALAAVSLLLMAAAPVVTYQYIAGLEEKLEQGKKQGLELQRTTDLAQKKNHCRRLLLKGQEALAKGTAQDLRVAQESFREARDQAEDPSVAGDEELDRLHQEASVKLAEVEQRIKKEEERAADRQLYNDVLQLRDEAFFLLHRNLVTGTDTASPEDSRQKALAALKEMGMLDQPAGAKWRLPLSLKRYSDDQRKELQAAVYEVVLLLAEATARVSPGGSSDALVVLDQAADLAPRRQAGLLRARLLEQQGQGAEAARVRARALQRVPETGLEWFLAGRDEFLGGRWQAAIEDFNQALRLDQHLFWAQFLRALALLQLQQPQSARDGLTLCIREREGEKYVWCYLLRGLLAGQAGDYQAAEDDFVKAEGLAGDDKSALYVLHDHRGLVALRRGEAVQAAALVAWGSPMAPILWGLRHEEARRAVEELRRAVKLRPELSPAQVNLARALADEQDLAGALDQVGAALRWKPDQPELYRERAALHVRGNDPKAARRDRGEAIRLEVERWILHVVNNATRRDLGEAIRLGHLEGPPPALALDFYERARLEYEARDLAAADRDCVASLLLEPRSAAALLLHGEVLLHLRRYRGALAAWDRYLRVEGAPGPEIFLQRARARALMNDFANLPQEYQRAFALRKDPSILAALGWVYVVNNSPDLAEKAFEGALLLAPDYAEAYAGRGFVKVLRGQYRDGVRDAEEGLARARRRGAVSARLLFNAARVYAQAAAAAVADGVPGSAWVLRDSYEGRAVELLAEALRAEKKPAARKRFWVENVQEDGALNPVRGSWQFKKLASEYQPAAR
jgi:tetratricopeptide (TPR) repeat protein